MSNRLKAFLISSVLISSISSLAWAGEESFQIQKSFNVLKALPKVKSLLKTEGNDLMIQDRVSGEGVQTTKFQHFYKGIEVVGSMALQHNGVAVSDVTDSLTALDLDTQPRLSAEEAVSIAQGIVGNRELLAVPALKIYPIFGQAGAVQLIYFVKLASEGDLPGHNVYINAHTGNVVADISHHMTIAPVDVYQTNKKCQSLYPFPDDLGGRAPISVNYKKCDMTIRQNSVSNTADTEAKQALKNSQSVLNYFLNVHGRNSFDGKGKTAVNVVHIGENWVNAFWNSEDDIMAYGDGDGKYFNNLTLSLDVAGHEMTHGVVSKTANLEYADQSGALNEALADFFGEMIEGQDNWVMGQDLFKDASQGVNGLRSIKNPHAVTIQWPDENGNPVERPYPAHMSEMFVFNEACNGNNDNCGVHLNSTVPSHTTYLITQAIGKSKTEKLMYTTLTQYLTATSDFAAFRDATTKACRMMYDSTTCNLVKGSFTKVGL